MYLSIASVAHDFHNSVGVDTSNPSCIALYSRFPGSSPFRGTCRTYHFSGQPCVELLSSQWRSGLRNASDYSILAIKQISQSTFRLTSSFLVTAFQAKRL